MTIFLPSKIQVGYCKRTDTYTGKLAYVIYFDQKGKLRKEKSWESWRDKDQGTDLFENEPTEGFVLNKKVGGAEESYGWDVRKTYARVYDPRGFEFEICVANLLYILENANCMKGKGLEGKFLYGWDGTELVLIPEAAPEYVKHKEFTEMLSNKSVKTKDLVLGGVYRSNKNIDYVYLGRFSYYADVYNYKLGKYECVNRGLHYFFQELGCKKERQYDKVYTYLKSLSGRIIKEVSNQPVADYAELMDDLEHQTCYSPYDPSKDSLETVPFEEYLERVKRGETAVYFTLGGVAVRSGVYYYWRGDKIDKFNGLERVEPLMENRQGWKGDYYSVCARDPWLDEQRAKLPNNTSYYSGYWGTKETMKDLYESYGMQVIKKYLANGREKH
jgi:hypothetical protein